MRDRYLDFLRGIASISVIFIHTAYHSGESYVPALVRTAALLVDVPFFMFLSGWSTYYSTDFCRMLRTFLHSWIFWITIITLLDILFLLCGLGGGFRDGGGEWIRQIFFIHCDLPYMTSFNWSIWYMTVFYPVVTLGTVIINGAKKYGWRNTDYLYLLFLAVIAVTHLTVSEQGTTFLLLPRMLWFYLFFFLLGYFVKQVDFYFKSLWTWIAAVLTVLCLWAALGKILAVSVTDLQAAKFPPNIMYLAASCLSVSTALFFRNKINSRFLNLVRPICYMGKNSICFYFSQGFGGALLFFVAPKLAMPWQEKIVVCFVINLCVSLAVGVLFVQLNRFLHTMIVKLKPYRYII